MKITLIIGSHRQNSQSAKIADYIQSRLDVDHDQISLVGNPLPLWDQGIWDGDPAWQQRLAPIKAQCQSSDAFIIITPEWHGQAPAGLKNLFLMLGKYELGHKPALLIGVSAGEGGIYPLTELRISSYKNNRLCYIPEQLIIRQVENMFNGEKAASEQDAYYRRRLDWCLDLLKQYAIALKTVRASGIAHHDDFPFGL